MKIFVDKFPNFRWSQPVEVSLDNRVLKGDSTSFYKEGAGAKRQLLPQVLTLDSEHRQTLPTYLLVRYQVSHAP